MGYAFLHRSLSIVGIPAAALLVTLVIFHPVRAETIDCTPITTLPSIITEQGIYCLTGNLSTAMTSGNAIEIQTNNVTIDLNAWKLGGLAAGIGTAANGIYGFDRKNVTIRNGTVRGFYRGILLDGPNAQGNLIEDVRAEQNTFLGIGTVGRGDIIRRNQVVDTGGSNLNLAGISASGAGVRMLDNDIVGVTATGTSTAYGIFQQSGVGTVIEGNRIAEIAHSGSGLSYGIYLTGSSNGLVCGNRISGMIVYSIEFDSASGGYCDNKVIGSTFNVIGGTNYGGNSPP